MNNIYLIDNITRLCKSKKVTKKKCLEDCDINRNFIYDTKNGKKPSIETLITLANYFETSIDELIGRQPSLSGADEISGNAAEIAELFSSLTETQQGELIGRAKMMIEQNEAEYRQEDAG